MAALRVLAGGFAPTAFICVNDIMAVGVLRALREKGLRVPEDVSVTGFDNIRLAEFCEPPLTTVHIPRDEIGRLAFAALIPDKEMPNIPGQEIVIEPEVVLRASTAKAKR
jgi:DNA-binding LacI/PurR family transcriptional regulator